MPSLLQSGIGYNNPNVRHAFGTTLDNGIKMSKRREVMFMRLLNQSILFNIELI